MVNQEIPSAWLHPKNLNEATMTQKLLASQVVVEDQFEHIQWIAGVDVSNQIKNPDRIYAAVVLLDRKTLQVHQRHVIAYDQQFPYITGFLGFREAPAIVEAFKGLKQSPQLVMVDGHGISHPRGLGIASHLGVLLDVPTIGVAKSILVGRPADSLGPAVGDNVPLVWKKQPLATVLRTKLRCNPLIISTGHRVSLQTAVQLVLECLRGYRLPEPTRQAHLAANAYRKLVN